MKKRETAYYTPQYHGGYSGTEGRSQRESRECIREGGKAVAARCCTMCSGTTLVVVKDGYTVRNSIHRLIMVGFPARTHMEERVMNNARDLLTFASSTLPQRVHKRASGSRGRLVKIYFTPQCILELGTPSHVRTNLHCTGTAEVEELYQLVHVQQPTPPKKANHKPHIHRCSYRPPKFSHS